MKTQTNTAKHTPWPKLAVTHQRETDYSWDLVAAWDNKTGLCIATCGKCVSENSESAVNAKRLAMCWNEHDQLIAQRDALRDACKALIADYVDCRPDERPDWTESKMQALQDALALCEPKDKEGVQA